MNPKVILTLIPVATWGTLEAQTVDTAWMQGADIQPIRVIANGVDSAVAQGRLRQRDTSVTCNGGEVRFDISTHFDSQSTIRRIHFRGGTGDSAHELWYYYDRDQHLRFAFERRGAVNGTQEEERVYYSVRGAVLHRDVRRLAGPGYPWGPIDAIANPVAWLRDPCD